MSVPEFLYKISFPEEALAYLRKTTKLIDELRLELNKLCSDLNKLHEMNQTMYSSMIDQLQNFKLQMQSQAVPISDIYISEVNSQNILFSYDLSPDLDLFQGIDRVFNGPSNLDPCTSILQTQIRLVTPLSCDLDPDITKPTSGKIGVSDETNPYKSDPSSLQKPTQFLFTSVP